MSWYCKVALNNPLHKVYHDTEYGFPLTGENVCKDECYLFELLSLELFQAGLSWELILKKRNTTVSAFDNFDIVKEAEELIDYLKGRNTFLERKLKDE